MDGAKPYCMATGGWGYIVSSTCKSPEAAWAFVDYMNNPENVGSWAINCGTLAARKDAVMDLSYDPQVGSVAKALSIAKDILPYGQEGRRLHAVSQQADLQHRAPAAAAGC